MPQPNTLRSTFYHILICLSAITLLIGSAAAPVATAAAYTDPTPTPADPPTTPAHADWEDWEARRGAEASMQMALDEAAASAPEEPMMYEYCDRWEPDIRYFTGLAYSGLSYDTGYDEDIYFHSNVCENDAFRRITSTVGADYEPQISPDGLRIVFASNRPIPTVGAISNIYTISIYGTDEQQITNAPGSNRMPSWSPDGKQIVFISTRTGNAEIYVMNSDGTGEKRLTDSAEADVEPNWSPDGKLITWVRRLPDGNGVVSIMRPDGTGKMPLLPPLPYAGQPHYSPSGTRLLLRLDANLDGWYDLAVVNANGTGLGVLPIYKGNKTEYTDLELGGWTPDESGIVYGVIGYVWEGAWYITSANIRKASFNQLSEESFYSWPRYAFTAHIRSLDDEPPVSTIQPLPEYSHFQKVPIRWTVTDNYSLPYKFDIRVSTASNPAWSWFGGADFIFRDPPYTGVFEYTGMPGDTVFFRIQSIDRAENSEPPNSTPDAWTKLYRWLARINTFDARERPLDGVQVWSDPDAMNRTVSEGDGSATMYFANDGRYTIDFTKNGYAPAPPARWVVNGNETFTAVLTGVDEQLENGHYEDPEPLEGWQRNGVIESATAAGRYGGLSARLGSLCSGTFCFHSPTPLGAHDPATPGAAIGIDPLGQAHVRYEGIRYGIVDESGNIQPWPDLPVQGDYGPIQFGPDNLPYMMAEAQFIYWDGGAWVVDPAPFIQESAVYYDMDAASRLHVLYGDYACGGCMMYTRRDPDGSWLPAIQVTTAINVPASLSVEPGGTAHVVYGSADYVRILLDGTITASEHLPTGSIIDNIYTKYVSGRGLFVAYNFQHGWRRFMQRNPAGQWFTISEGGTGGRAYGIQADSAGNVYLLHKLANVPALSLVAAGQQTLQPYVTLTSMDNIYSFAVGPQGQPHIVYGEVVNSQFRYFHRRGAKGTITGSGAIEQPVVFGEVMLEPTLSFFYQIEGGEGGPLSQFEVKFLPTEGEPTTLFLTPAVPEPWKHVWVDLTPFVGQSGTIAFQLTQNSGTPARVFIDEASVSSDITPSVTLIDPDSLAMPIAEGTWVDLYGQNFRETTQVFIGGTPAQDVEWIDTGHMRIQLPEITLPGTYTVKLVNPDGLEGDGALHVGLTAFLPTLKR